MGRYSDGSGDDSEERTLLHAEELPLRNRPSLKVDSRVAGVSNGSPSWNGPFFPGSSAPKSPYPYGSRRRSRRCWRSPRAFFAWLVRFSCWTLIVFGVVAILTAWLFPSYTTLPPHYSDLLDHAGRSTRPGRANVNNERIYVAASLYDPEGDLISGKWGDLVRDLVDLLGPENTFVSIFESDSGDKGALALQDYDRSFHSDHKFVSVDEIKLDSPPIITLPDGTETVRRIEYLAQARNQALLPLLARNAPQYDKVLFLNDVIFDPVEAAQLLLSTNIQPDGRTSYKAACAQDFKSPFLMYDMLATRDADGWQLGVPLFPWFSTAASGKSRSDVLNQHDAVEVKSCWGGMVAFEAQYFQETTSNAHDTSVDLPLRFRSEQDLFHESSECCLVHADLMELPRRAGFKGEESTQIYMNPYVRTAYDERTFRWLWLGKRLERLFPFIQRIVTYYAGLPYRNDRRDVNTGQPLEQVLYQPSESTAKGEWRIRTAPAHPGSYCSIINLMVKRLDRNKEKSNWETIGPEMRAEMLATLKRET